jgi:hypothetical protein
VFDNRVLREVFGPKRKEVAGGWKKLHMRNFITFASPNVSRVTK